MSRRIAVVGCTGWVGRALVDAATAEGWVTIGVARRGAPGVAIVAPGADELGAAVVACTPDVIVNCVGRSTGSTSALIDSNIDVVRSLLHAASVSGARLVQLGSAAEYGSPPPGVSLDEGSRLAPLTDYARSKALATSLVVESPVDAVVARLFNIAGPCPPAHSFLREMIGKVGTDAPVELMNADLRRDWVSLDLVVRALLRLAVMPTPRVVNICSGTAVSHGELVAAMGRQVGRHLEIRSHGGAGVAEVVGDPSLLVAATGLDPACSVDALAAAAMSAA